MEHFSKRLLRKKNKKQVSIRGSHFSTHGGAVDLEIVVIIKGEIIHGEDHANEVAECTSGNGFVGGSAKYKPTESFQGTHFNSCHPPGIKNDFIKGEAMRLLRINSSKTTFEASIVKHNA